MRTKRSLVLMSSVVMVLAFGSMAVARRSPKAPPTFPGSSKFVSAVDNEFFPLAPGTAFFYAGEKDGIPGTDKMYVTHQTKQILGVACTVVHDRVFENGILTEDTFDWYAQDVDGNVWYFGEDSKELDAKGNVISTEGSWEAGVNGARPGIIMEADPRVGDLYYQEFSKGVAEDVALVDGRDKSACVAYGCFDDLLVTKEWTRLDSGVVEKKYYAPGVGFILEDTVQGGNEHSELTTITTK